MPVPSDVLTTTSQLNPQSAKVGLTAAEAADAAAAAAASSAAAAAGIQAIISAILGTLSPQATSLTIPAGQIASVALGGVTGELTLADTITSGRQCRIHYSRTAPFCAVIDSSYNDDNTPQWLFQTGVIGAVTTNRITVSVNSGDGKLYVGNGNAGDITLVISPLIATSLGTIAVSDMSAIPNVVPTPAATHLVPYVEGGNTRVTPASSLITTELALAAVAAAVLAVRGDFTGGRANADPGGRRLIDKFSHGEIDVRDYISDTSHASIEAGTNLNDLTSNIQKAYNDSQDYLRRCILPSGVYYVSSIDVATAARQSGCLMGAGRGFYPVTGAPNYRSPTVLKGFDVNLPIIAANLGRGVLLSDFAVVGLNTGASQAEPSADPTTWVSGVTDLQYKPQCGIGIDVYTGTTPPGGGYPGKTYIGGTNGTSDMTIQRVNIQQCAVGVMNNPSFSGAQGDAVRILDCFINLVKVGYASGCGQANVCVLRHSVIGNMHTIVDTLTYGQKQGLSPYVYDLSAGPGFQLFNLADGFKFAPWMGVSAESMKRLGNIGVGGSAGKEIFELYVIQFHGNESWAQPPLFLVNFAPVHIHGLDAQINSSGLGIRGIPWNFGGSGDLIVDNAKFVVADVYKADVGLPFAYNKKVSGRNWRLEDLNSRSVTLMPDADCASSPAGPSPTTARAILHPCKLRHPGAGVSYDVTLGRLDSAWPIAGNTSVVWDNVNKRVSFSAASAALAAFYFPGDRIFHRIVLTAPVLLQDILPALEVVSVVGTTVTCKAAGNFDYTMLDQAYSLATAYIVMGHWAATATFTGNTTTGSPIVTGCNRDPATVLRVADWFAVVGGYSIGAPSRVLSLDSVSQFTGVSNAISSVTGQKIFLDKLSLRTVTDAF
jgi:hypothetical protein